jgi:hypothetical protein
MWISFLVKPCPMKRPSVSEPVDDLRHPDALARRSALMRTVVVVREILPRMLDDGNLNIL